MPTSLSCERCNALISPEELGEGLAVRVDGELVCQNCVDTLPGEAQVRINQLRALKGLTATTYQVTLAQAPRLQLFSFTTSGNITNHRRKLSTDGFFEAPPLPPPSEREKPPPPPEPAPRPSTTRIIRRRLTPAMIAAAATIVLLVGGAGVLSWLAARKPPAKGGVTAEAPPAKPQPPKPLKTRLDYAVEPLQAWTQAAADRDCPDYVRQAIAQELGRKRAQQLAEAETALGDRRLDDAASLANALVLPDDLAFRELKTRESNLRNRLLAMRTQPPMPDPTPVPAPAPVTEAAPAPTPAPAPSPAPIVQASADGRILLLTADAADLAGTKLRIGGPPDARVVGSWTDPADSPVWRVRFAAGGTYAIAAKCSAMDGASAVIVQIADGQAEATVPRSVTWEQLSPLVFGTLEVARAGDLLVRLKAKDPAAWKPVNVCDLTLRRVDPPPPAVSSSDTLLIAARDLLADQQPPEWRREGNTTIRLLVASGGASRALVLAGGSYQVWVKASHRTKDALVSLAIGGQRAKPIQLKAGVPQWYRVHGEGSAIAVLPAGPALLEVAASPKDTQIHELYLAGDTAPGADDAVKQKLGKPPTWTAAPAAPPPVAGVPGRFVRIQLPRKLSLSLAEVEVFSAGANIAGRGTASQSSTDQGGEAKRAIDGNTAGDFGRNSTTHTRDDDAPWWEVDLGAVHPVEAVAVWNRLDCCGDRLEGFTVVVLDADRREVARSAQTPAPRESVRIPLIGDGAGSVQRPAVAWKPQFLQVGGKETARPLPLDGSAALPSGWPGGADGFFRSQRTSSSRKRQALHLDLAQAGADSIVLLLHGQRPDRKQLAATLVDAGGKNVPLPPIVLVNDGWTAAVVSTRGLALDARSLNALILEDEVNMDGTPEDAGFILARAALVSGRDATPGDLGVRPSVLLRDDNRVRSLKRPLDAIAGARKRQSWQRLLEPDRLRVLVGPSNDEKQGWQPWRNRTKDLLETLTPGKLPSPTFAELVMQDSWLDTMTKGQTPALDPATAHLAVLWPMGDELALGGVNQALDGFWKKRIEQLISAGSLPIVVLGPNRQQGQRRDEAEQLWPKLAEFVTARQLGLAVVDLRSVRTGQDGALAQADGDLASRLLADALGEYLYHLKRMGAVKQ